MILAKCIRCPRDPTAFYRYMLCFACIAAMVAAPAHARQDVEIDTVLRLIRDRASSITDYYMTGEFCTVQLPAGRLAHIRTVVDDLLRHEDEWAGTDITDIKSAIHDVFKSKHVTTSDRLWGSFSTAVTSKAMRIDQSWPTGMQTQVFRTSDVHMRVLPTTVQHQVDILTVADEKMVNGILVSTFLCGAVSVGVKGEPDVAHADGGGYTITYSTESGTRGMALLDEELVVKNRTTYQGESILVDEWFMTSSDIGRYRIPRISLVIHPQADAVLLSVYIIDTIELGHEKAAKHAVAPRIPANSRFVDKRVEPSRVRALPGSMAANYSHGVPADELFHTVEDYWNEQDRLMATPTRPATDPFSGGDDRSMGSWIFAGTVSLVLLIGGVMGYGYIKRRSL